MHDLTPRQPRRTGLEVHDLTLGRLAHGRRVAVCENSQQAAFVPALIQAPCKPPYAGQLTNIGSDWHDIDAVVDHVRKIRSVQRIGLVAWSLGGPRGRRLRRPAR